MSEPAALGEFFKWVGQAAVVGIGWYVVHRLSVHRDRDKARRDLVTKSVDGLIDSLDVLLVAARTYHLQARDINAEMMLKMTLQDMGMRVNSMSIVCNEVSALSACRAEVTALRRAITGSHFEDEHQAPLIESDQQIEDIADVVLRAKRQLLRLKHLQFPVEEANR